MLRERKRNLSYFSSWLNTGALESFYNNRAPKADRCFRQEATPVVTWSKWTRTINTFFFFFFFFSRVHLSLLTQWTKAWKTKQLQRRRPHTLIKIGCFARISRDTTREQRFLVCGVGIDINYLPLRSVHEMFWFQSRLFKKSETRI